MKRKKIEPKTKKKTIQRNEDKGNNKTVNCRRLLLLLMPKTMILCSGFEVLATKSRISSENNVFFFRSSQKYRLFCVICLLFGSFIYRPTVRPSVCFSMSKQKSSFIRLCCAVFDSVVSSEHMSILHLMHHTASKHLTHSHTNTDCNTVCLVTKNARHAKTAKRIAHCRE